MLKVALTGGIASGKSVVAELFAQHHIHIVDADIIARSLVEPGQPAFATITERWGNSIVQDDGQLNRTALRELIFADPHHRKWLETLLHPLIRETMQVEAEQASSAYVIMVIPLLDENTPKHLYDRILMVEAGAEIRLQRLLARDNIDITLANNMIEAQMKRECLAKADDIIHNRGHRAELSTQVDKLHKKYLNLSEVLIHGQ